MFTDCIVYCIINQEIQILEGKLSRQSENFPDCPKTFQTVWKLSKLSGKFSYSRKSNLRAFGKYRKNNLCTFGANVAKKIYALCPESFCDRKVGTF